MPTTNQLLAQAIRDKWLGVEMLCIYNDKYRIGKVMFVKQGAAVKKMDGTFFFLNEPDGEVYVDFHQDNGRVRCFLWKKVIDPQDYSTRSMIKPATLETTQLAMVSRDLVIRRPRPIA